LPPGSRHPALPSLHSPRIAAPFLALTALLRFVCRAHRALTCPALTYSGYRNLTC